MIVKRNTWTGILLAGLFVASPFLLGHGIDQEAGKYADAKAILEKLASALELFAQDMNAAENTTAIAECLEVFTASMTELVPGLTGIREKYPELKDETTHPEELKPLLHRVDKDFVEMMKAYGKVKENLDDPSVKASDDKYKEVMSKLK